MPVDCTAPDVLDADPDIVGPGVLAAFFASALSTIAAVLYALYLGIADDTHPQSLNGRLIAQTRQQIKGQAPHQHHIHALHLFRFNNEEKKDILTRTILALSDQQLVTGLAIMVAGVSGPTYITGYEYGVVLALAWFSSTTHLATLTALRRYLHSAGRVRDVRVLGMLVVLVLLMYLLFTSLPVLGGVLPIACGPTTTLGSALPVGNILALIQVLGNYAARIHDLYFGTTNLALLPTLFLWKMKRVDTDGLTYRELFAEYVAENNLRAVLATSRGSSLRQRLSRAWYCYERSFLSTLPGVAFSFAYGVTQLVWYRWLRAPRLGDESNRMGFGQVLPLVLLLLPILAAGESYNDYQIKKLEMAKQTSNEHRDEPHNTYTAHKSEAVESQDPDSNAQSAAVFDNCLPDIQKYFCRDVRLAKASRGDMDSRKASILRQYHFVTILESHVDTRLVYLLTTIDLLVMIALGILLPWPSDDQPTVTYAIAIPLFALTKVVSLAGLLRSGYESAGMYRTVSHTTFERHPSRAAFPSH